jgi:hypothetical protein
MKVFLVKSRWPGTASVHSLDNIESVVLGRVVADGLPEQHSTITSAN